MLLECPVEPGNSMLMGEALVSVAATCSQRGASVREQCFIQCICVECMPGPFTAVACSCQLFPVVVVVVSVSGCTRCACSQPVWESWPWVF